MEHMIAYCGLDCKTCPIHLATLVEDPAQQRIMRLGIARVCSEQYGMAMFPEEVTDCDGCISPTKRLFSGCARCEIRACATEKGMASCAACQDYACEKLTTFFLQDPAARDRLEALRRRYKS